MPTRYEGAIDWPEPSADDPREKIDKACHPKCASAWDTYLKCGERIEAKVCGHNAARALQPTHSLAQGSTAPPV